MSRITDPCLRSLAFAGSVIALSTFVVGCGTGSDEPAVGRSIEQVLADQTPTLMAVDGVVGTGIGECEGIPCIKVFVATTTVAVTEEIPGEIDGYVVRVEETGPITALEPE